ncbi:MAG: hypothetical protein IKF68_04295 [Erysipelotrichaceae bacterium]|nr:hypothetical protein [Erysipelotrichaceae bacterium]
MTYADEVDAFPLSGNTELMNIALGSVRGNIIFSTATVNSFLEDVLKKRKVRELKLYIRPSLRPLTVPKLFHAPAVILYPLLFILLKRMKRQCIIFVSAKKECYRLYLVFRLFFSCTYVYADAKDRDRNIREFKDRKHRFIFATTVLERGITIKGVNVIVLDLHRNIFSEENIVQMLGRVGRDVNDPYGDAYILYRYKDTAVSRAVAFIKEANEISKMSLLR